MARWTAQRACAMALFVGTSWIALLLIGPAAFGDDQVVDPQTWNQLARDEDVTIDINVNYYPINGSTIPDLNQSMVTQGSKATDSKHTIGSHWGRGRIAYLLWQWPGSCELGNHTITYTGKTILPKWHAPKDASLATRAWWDATFTDIREHEQEHAFINVVEMLALERVVENLPGTANCSDFSAEVKAANDERWRAARTNNKAFDQWTNHGIRGPYWLG